jgi:hypothetical protein
MATVAFTGQRFFEWQAEGAQKVTRANP